MTQVRRVLPAMRVPQVRKAPTELKARMEPKVLTATQVRKAPLARKV
ncbi:MAG TPA: hypothetical protein VNP96_12920 [Solirubrobacterales bacterium]|nr:hypothetical protein [Solirubrobacterales bacterium]